jgi:hypothetical protein
MDDESDWSRASELQNNRIDIRHVIWHQQKARVREIFEPKCSYPVEYPGDKVPE